jgi:hypothetical protein
MLESTSDMPDPRTRRSTARRARGLGLAGLEAACEGLPGIGTEA